jgi:hypothetical protein
MDWSWWFKELATAITAPHPLNFHVRGYMINMMYECKVNRREELNHQIYNAAR